MENQSYRSCYLSLLEAYKTSSVIRLNIDSNPSHKVELEELAPLLEKLSLATQNPFQGVEPSMGAS